MKIKYYNGRTYIEVEVDEEFAKGYQRVQQEEWRVEKAVKRHESLTGREFADAMPTNSKKQEQLQNLRRVIKALSKDQQEILKMAFEENKSHSEIGEAFGVSKQAIQQRMETILKKLKKLF